MSSRYVRGLAIAATLAAVGACGDPAPPILSAGDTHGGSLTQHDTLIADLDTFVDFVGIDVEAGQRVAVVLESQDFAPALYLNRITNTGLEMLRVVPGRLDGASCSQVRPPTATRYLAFVASQGIYDGLAIGRYSLRVEALADDAPAPRSCSALGPLEML